MAAKDSQGRLREQGRFIKAEQTVEAQRLADLEEALLTMDPESTEHRDALRTINRWKAELFGP